MCPDLRTLRVGSDRLILNFGAYKLNASTPGLVSTLDTVKGAVPDDLRGPGSYQTCILALKRSVLYKPKSILSLRNSLKI